MCSFSIVLKLTLPLNMDHHSITKVGDLQFPTSSQNYERWCSLTIYKYFIWSACVGLTCKFDGFDLKKKACDGDEYHGTLAMVFNTSNIHYFSSQYFFDLEGIVYENFNISENNIISVELAKVLGYHI